VDFLVFKENSIYPHIKISVFKEKARQDIYGADSQQSIRAYCLLLSFFLIKEKNAFFER